MQVYYDASYRGQEQRAELPLHVDRTVFGEADAVPNVTDFDSCFKHTDLPSENYNAEDMSSFDYGVLEFKVSKAKLAESIKLPGGESAGMTADDITSFRFTLQYCDADGVTRLCAPLTDDEMSSGRINSNTYYPPNSNDNWFMTGAGRSYFGLCVNLSDEAVAPLPTAPATSATTAPPATSAPATSATAAPATSATVAPATSATVAPATSATAAPASSATTAADTTAAATTAAATTTAKDTAAATTAATTAAEDRGCGGTLTVSALALLPVIAGGAWIVRKKED